MLESEIEALRTVAGAIEEADPLDSALGTLSALAHQIYSNPGPEEAWVAPSDRDSGSVISIQYSRPLKATHTVIVRSGWSWSQTGFRDDFYERFQTSLYLTFRGT